MDRVSRFRKIYLNSDNCANFWLENLTPQIPRLAMEWHLRAMGQTMTGLGGVGKFWAVARLVGCVYK